MVNFPSKIKKRIINFILNTDVSFRCKQIGAIFMTIVFTEHFHFSMLECAFFALGVGMIL